MIKLSKVLVLFIMIVSLIGCNTQSLPDNVSKTVYKEAIKVQDIVDKIIHDKSLSVDDALDKLDNAIQPILIKDIFKTDEESEIFTAISELTIGAKIFRMTQSSQRDKLMEEYEERHNDLSLLLGIETKY